MVIITVITINWLETNEEVNERLNKFEKEIDSVEADQVNWWINHLKLGGTILFSQPEGLEAILRKMRYCLHENHYLITGQIHS